MAADPISPYGVAKLAAERYCVSFSRVYHRFESVVLRYFNVFGPRQSPHSQYAAVIPLFITAIAAGRADHDLRRRRAVARLHLRRQRRRRDHARRRRARRERPHPQRRRRLARDGERGRALDRRDSRPESRRSTICRRAPATSATRGHASTRRASCSASSRACTSTKASRAPCGRSSAEPSRAAKQPRARTHSPTERRSAAQPDAPSAARRARRIAPRCAGEGTVRARHRRGGRTRPASPAHPHRFAGALRTAPSSRCRFPSSRQSDRDTVDDHRPYVRRNMFAYVCPRNVPYETPA